MGWAAVEEPESVKVGERPVPSLPGDEPDLQPAPRLVVGAPAPRGGSSELSQR